MEKTFQIYYTSDTHGHVFPVNYASNSPENAGLLNLAAQVEKDGNTLVLDGGDALQGTPLTQYYLEHRGEWPIHPVAAAFNAMGLDYFTLGNHDFNFGYEALREYLEAMLFSIETVEQYAQRFRRLAEEHPHVIVRKGGFSIYFTDLLREVQRDMIERFEMETR